MSEKKSDKKAMPNVCWGTARKEVGIKILDNYINNLEREIAAEEHEKNTASA